MIKRFGVNNTPIFIGWMALASRFLRIDSFIVSTEQKIKFAWAFFVGLTSSQLVWTSRKIMNEIKSTQKKLFQVLAPLPSYS